MIIITVVIAHFLALLSPGPDFMLLIKSCIKNGARNALGLALGIASANAVYIALCIFGVGEFLISSIFLLRVLKILGGLFLLSIAFSAFRTSKDKYSKFIEVKDSSNNKDSFSKEFIKGFLSGITNPKNLVFYLSLFAMVLTENIGLEIKVGLGIWMTFLVFLWDSMILYILSRGHIRKVFTKVAFYIDKVAGAVIGLVGFKLIFSDIDLS